MVRTNTNVISKMELLKIVLELCFKEMDFYEVKIVKLVEMTKLTRRYIAQL